MKSLKQYITEQVLLEAVKREDLLKMFKPEWFVDRPKNSEFVQHYVDLAIEKFKKNNRIVWFMYWVRLTAEYMYYIDEQSFDEANKWYDVKLAELEKKFGVMRSQDPMQSPARSTVNYIATQLEHYFDLNIPEINNYSFGQKWPFETFSDLHQIEQEYLKDNPSDDRLILANDPEEKNNEVILKFSNGWEWSDLKRTRCADDKGSGSSSRQGKSMQDCATTAGKTLIVLREPVKIKGRDYWKQHLRFEINKDGSIGQSKGYANSKPKPEYHKYIVALLTQDKFPINGIKSGVGYRPETDFSLTDLSQDDQDKLVDYNPNLVSLDYWIKKYGVNDQRVLEQAYEILRSTYKAELLASSSKHLGIFNNYPNPIYFWANADFESLCIDALSGMQYKHDKTVLRWLVDDDPVLDLTVYVQYLLDEMSDQGKYRLLTDHVFEWIKEKSEEAYLYYHSYSIQLARLFNKLSDDNPDLFKRLRLFYEKYDNNRMKLAYKNVSCNWLTSLQEDITLDISQLIDGKLIRVADIKDFSKIDLTKTFYFCFNPQNKEDFIKDAQHVERHATNSYNGLSSLTDLLDKVSVPKLDFQNNWEIYYKNSDNNTAMVELESLLKELIKFDA